MNEAFAWTILFLCSFGVICCAGAGEIPELQLATPSHPSADNFMVESSNTIRHSNGTKPEQRPKRPGRRCLYPEGCSALSKKIIYGVAEKGAEPQFCKDHRGPKHINLMTTKFRCEFLGCLKQGVFGIRGQPATNRTLYCKEHRPDERHEDVRNRNCRHPSCTRRASYGQRRSGVGPVFCKQHSADTDSNLHGHCCDHPGCARGAIFGSPPPPPPPTEAPPQATEDNRASSCVNGYISTARGGGSSCGRRTGIARFCAAHKRPGHVDLRNKRCEARLHGWDLQAGRAGSYPCPRRASFGPPQLVWPWPGPLLMRT